MTPILAVAPTEQPVAIEELRGFCRIDGEDHDATLSVLRDAAIGHLDGWSGILGRAIMAQDWSIEIDAAGTVLLPLPDVSTASVDYGSGTEALEITQSPRGALVTLTAAGSVTFRCALPEAKRAEARAIILFMVKEWFDGMVGGKSVAALSADVPTSINGLIHPLRWRRI